MVRFLRFFKGNPELEVDTKVFVAHGTESKWKPRYFKGWDKQGSMLCYSDGKTSFSSLSNDDTNKWRRWKIAEGEHKDETNLVI